MSKRVFFSFHYQDVIDFRANVVRNHWLTKPNRDSAGFFDASVWEKAKKESKIALKRLINGAIKGTSTSCVLIGDQTYARNWVRYEIFHSIYSGNALFGVHINNIKDKHQRVKNLGPNPFNNLGLYSSEDGKKVSPVFLEKNKWHYFSDYPGYSLNTPWVNHKGKVRSLTEIGHKVYNWTSDDGFNNFASWVG
ncbi:TIR domain-containing protein [Desulfovibrio sp. UCD-KL4C]|uniref:TIR domain-containing protein n=1 Tax=Desulfovibrio sp. UCD-KL4C TaxID=2578120 RepID=UPI0025C73F54|nr:TIR domain-containing protein [Desulfovibrio sp. UCD-KL4C]